MADKGLTHIALPVTDLDASISFYSRYAEMKVVQRRNQVANPKLQVAWLSDLTRPFVLVLSEAPIEHPLGPFAHLGVACSSQEEIRRMADLAQSDGCFRDGPHGSLDHPAGIFIYLSDPDGHTLELSYGQDIGLAVDNTPSE